MLEMDTITWEEPPLSHQMKVERNLNFATLPNDEDDFGFSRKKTARDPMSHRIIEKRRRDRMNNCLADLSRLVPTNYLKKGRGRIEKTEIIEMAIKHLKHLQAHPCKDPANCEVAKTTEQDHKRQFRFGYTESMNEALRFVSEAEGVYVDSLYTRLATHLQKHYEKMAGGLCYTQALTLMVEESKSHMDVDRHSSPSHFPSESNSNSGILHPTPSYYENCSRHTNDLKLEAEASIEHPKVTSQLREMLQNPGIPKDRCGSMSLLPPQAVDTPKMDDGVYKFKNTIKHRFNADLRHHTSSPTDSHFSDRMSLPDDDKPLTPGSPSLRQSHPDERLNPPPLLCNGGFSPYQTSSELSVKIPAMPLEHGTLSTSYNTQHWDSHAETTSSCGSNSSPPLNTTRSNGSSSGYSTNGDNHHTGGKQKGNSSPTLSPYSLTPDLLSNSPNASGVPIFALHPKGSFYIPLTVESSLLIPYLVGVDDLAPVLHPISICVNLSGHSLKVEQSSYLTDKFHDRLVYSERQPIYYPCPTSPNRNGCT